MNRFVFREESVGICSRTELIEGTQHAYDHTPIPEVHQHFLCVERSFAAVSILSPNTPSSSRSRHLRSYDYALSSSSSMGGSCSCRGSCSRVSIASMARFVRVLSLDPSSISFSVGIRPINLIGSTGRAFLSSRWKTNGWRCRTKRACRRRTVAQSTCCTWTMSNCSLAANGLSVARPRSRKDKRRVDVASVLVGSSRQDLCARSHHHRSTYLK